MKKPPTQKVFRLIRYALLAGLLLLLFKVFVPRTYNVPQAHSRDSTRYWNLPTGSKIAYTRVSAKGRKQPYPIIFLQGGPGGFITDRNIDMLAPLSADGYDVYLYDQIGSGQSERLANLRDYTPDRHAKDLAEIVQQIGSEKVILIAQSWGACLATVFLASHPEKVEQVVFTGAGPILPVREALLDTHPPDSLHLRKPPYSNREANERVNNIRTSAMAFFASFFGIKLASDKEMDDFQTCLNHELNKAVVCDTSKALKAEGGGGFYAHVMTVEHFSSTKDPRPALQGCAVPILLMRGQCDNQPWGFTEEYLALFPNHQLKIIPDAGHSISIEQPELYLKTIRDFLLPASTHNAVR